MKDYKLWKDDLKTNSVGGLIPEDKKKAKHVDLITLPKNVEGTNCFNCKWVMNKKGDIRHCDHPEVQSFVNKRMCCGKWDNPGAKRDF